MTVSARVVLGFSGGRRRFPARAWPVRRRCPTAPFLVAAAQVQDGAKLDNRSEDQRDAPNTLPNLFPGKAGDEAEQRWRRRAHDARGREPTRPGRGSSVTTTACTSGVPFPIDALYSARACRRHRSVAPHHLLNVGDETAIDPSLEQSVANREQTGLFSYLLRLT